MRHTLLLIDESPACREPLTESLRARGNIVHGAASLAQAEAVLQVDRPDLVIIDIDIEQGKGLAFVVKLADDPSAAKTPVIILTDCATRETVETCIKLGVRGYLLKSQFSLADLYHRIDRILTAPAARGKAKTVIGVASDSGDAVRVDAAGGVAMTAGGGVRETPRGGTPSLPSSFEELKPLMGRTEITDLIKSADDLNPISPSVDETLKQLRSTRCSIESVAKSIRRDHGLAVKILRLANSAAYMRSENIDTVERAVVRIGIEKIRQLLMNLTVVDNFTSVAIADHVTMATFWDHSIACAIIAAEICRQRDEEPDVGFTMGLVHDVGQLVYANLLGERYTEIVTTAARLHLPLDAVERRMLLIDHAGAMDLLLHRWHFPRDLVDPVAFHHLPPKEIQKRSPKYAMQIATIGLADRLAHALVLGTSGNDLLQPLDELVELLELSADTISEIEPVIQKQTQDMRLTLLSMSTEGAWETATDSLRARLGEPARILFISRSPQLDPYRICCDQLSSPELDKPNVIVVIFTGARDRDTLSERLVACERDASVKNLPIIAISPKAAFVPDPVIVGRERQVVALPWPTTTRALVDGIRQVVTGGKEVTPD